MAACGRMTNVEIRMSNVETAGAPAKKSKIGNQKWTWRGGTDDRLRRNDEARMAKSETRLEGGSQLSQRRTLNAQRQTSNVERDPSATNHFSRITNHMGREERGEGGITHAASASESGARLWISLSRLCKRGEGGIRTLGALLRHGALAKRCFQPLSHLTKFAARI